MTMVYMCSRVYRGAITISEIKIFSDKHTAIQYKIIMQRKEPYVTFRLWESMLDSKTFITKIVR